MTRSRPIRSLGWVLLALCATAVAVFSLRYALPHVPAPARLSNVITRRDALTVHAVCASVALLVGPWQFLGGLRARHLQVHRALGRVYVAAVVAGWVASLPIALHAQTGGIASAGFLALGVCWICATGMAVARVLRGDIAGHRRWMVRSYACTAAAITLRIYLGLILAFGLDFVTGYRVIAWLCWVPNLVGAEFIRRRWDVAPKR